MKGNSRDKNPNRQYYKTVSQAQLEANRANAKKSRGPSSDEGKEHSKFNALKDGGRGAYVLLPNEPEELYLAHIKGVVHSMMPQSMFEWKLSVRIAQNEWRIDRILNLETQAIQMTNNRQDLEAEISRLSNVEARLDRSSHRNCKIIGFLTRRRKELCGSPRDEAFQIPELTFYDLFNGPCVGIQMPLTQEEGREWQEHLDDVAMACMPADQLPPVEVDPNRQSWATQDKKAGPMREADINDPKCAHWFSPEEHEAHRLKKLKEQAGSGAPSPQGQLASEGTSPSGSPKADGLLAQDGEPHNTGEGASHASVNTPQNPALGETLKAPGGAGLGSEMGSFDSFADRASPGGQKGRLNPGSTPRYGPPGSPF